MLLIDSLPFPSHISGSFMVFLTDDLYEKSRIRWHPALSLWHNLSATESIHKASGLQKNSRSACLCILQAQEGTTFWTAEEIHENQKHEKKVKNKYLFLNNSIKFLNEAYTEISFKKKKIISLRIIIWHYLYKFRTAEVCPISTKYNYDKLVVMTDIKFLWPIY